MRIIINIVVLIISVIIGTFIIEYIIDRQIYKQLKYIHRYLKIMDMDDVMIKCKGKYFYISVDLLSEDPLYKKLLYINNELVLTAYELNHGFTDSRQLEYNDNRNPYEINKLLRLAYKKLKRLYYDKYLKVDYNFKSFWED